MKMLYRNWRVLVSGLISVVVVILVFSFCGVELVFREKREASSGKADFCVKNYGGIELNYTEGTATTFQIDLCDVIQCGKTPSSWRGYDIYLCATPVVQPVGQ